MQQGEVNYLRLHIEGEESRPSVFKPFPLPPPPTASRFISKPSKTGRSPGQKDPIPSQVNIH